MDAPGLITMRNNLPVVDYARNHATQVPIQRCPTGAIVWLDPKSGPIKGAGARTRSSARARCAICRPETA